MADGWYQIDLKQADGTWTSWDEPGKSWSEVYCRALMRYGKSEFRIRKMLGTWKEFLRDVGKDGG